MTHRGCSSRWLSPLPSQFSASSPFDSSHRELFPPRPNSPRRTAGASKNIAPWPEASNGRSASRTAGSRRARRGATRTLTGAWTSDSVHGIPRERPVAQGNRAVRDRGRIRRAGRSARRRRARARTTRQAPARAGATAPCAADTTFRLTSLIVSPAERTHAGNHAVWRVTTRTARPRELRRGSVQHLRGLHALRPLHHPGHRRFGDAGALRQRQRDPADAGPVRDQLRDDSRHTRSSRSMVVPTSRPASGSISAIRGAAGRATPSSSRRRTSPTKRACRAGTATDFGTVRPCISLSTSPASPTTSCCTT